MHGETPGVDCIRLSLVPFEQPLDLKGASNADGSTSYLDGDRIYPDHLPHQEAEQRTKN